MTVQEPDELGSGEITDANIDDYAAIVYKKDQLDPGLKKLGLVPLKDALSYNQHKVDNLAILLGFPKDAGIDEHKYDYKNEVQLDEGETTLLSKVECLRDYTGVPYTPQTPPPTSLQSQITATNEIVGDGAGLPPDSTLTDNVVNLWAEVGTGGGGGGNNLSSRVAALETKVGNESTGSRSLTDIVGDGDSIEVGKTLSEVVGNTPLGDTSGTPNTLTQMAKKVSDDVYNANTGLEHMNTIVGDGDVGQGHSGSLSANVKEINQTLDSMKGSVYVFKGSVNADNIASVIGTAPDWLVWGGGEVWNVDLPPEGTDVLAFNYPKPGSDPNDTIPYSFKQGANFAYVKPEGTDIYGTFDNLGSVADVTNLEDRVSDLESRFDCSTQTVQNWTSEGLTGTHLITAYKGAPMVKLFAFIAQFADGQCLTPNVIDLSGNFTEAFQISQSNYKISSNISFDSINVFKLSSVEE